MKSSIFILNWSWMGEGPQLINFDQFQIDSVITFIITALYFIHVLDGNPDCANVVRGVYQVTKVLPCLF